MKKNSILIFITAAIIILSGCKLGLNHYEDRLYSEKIFTDYIENNINQNNNIFTRERAIEKAIAVFDKGLNIKIDRTKLPEYVRLYRDSVEDTFKWHIRWDDNNSKNSYECEIDSSNGDIINIGRITYSKAIIDKSVISIDEAKNIIAPLLAELNININDYHMSINNETPIDNKLSGYYGKSQYINLIFINTFDKSNKFVIYVDYSEKKVVFYSRVKLIKRYPW